MKSVSEILNSIINNLRSLNSPLAKVTNYSNAYAIFRSIASVISQQYLDLDNYYQNSFIISATGINLDARAKDFNMYRTLGSPASGYVYATATSDITLPINTILNSVASQFQYQTTQESIVSSSGVYIPIKSIVNSELANLSAGNSLVSPLYPNIRFTIGNYVDLNNTFSGGLQGGKSPESDATFRTRILSQISNQSKGNLSSIINTLNEFGLSKFFIKEAYPITGYFTIYIDTLDKSIIDSIEEALVTVKPIGVAFDIKTLSTYYIDLRFNVTLTSVEFAETVSNSIRQICYDYFNSFELEQELYPANLAILCSNIQGIRDIRVIDPSDTKVIPPKETILKVRDIQLTLNSGG